MCGIIGPVGPRQVTREAFVKARETMHPRGPDDEGLLEEPEAPLGFRRLSILDLSPTGAQPMTSACGRCGIGFNGEVYNFRELRTALDCGVDFFRAFSPAREDPATRSTTPRTSRRSWAVSTRPRRRSPAPSTAHSDFRSPELWKHVGLAVDTPNLAEAGAGGATVRS